MGRNPTAGRHAGGLPVAPARPPHPRTSWQVASARSSGTPHAMKVLPKPDNRMSGGPSGAAV